MENYIVVGNLSLNQGSQEERLKLKDMIDSHSFNITMYLLYVNISFDSVQKKTMLSLDVENYKGFINSQECKSYIIKKNQTQPRGAMM